MINNKYLFFASLLFVLLSKFAVSQETATPQNGGAQWSNRNMLYTGSNYDFMDSTYIPKNRRKQHRKFLNHQYAFPAKPRSMWEVGVGGGLYNVHGRIPSLMLWAKGGYALDVQVRKSWGYVFSTRLQYNYGVAKGLDWNGSTDYALPYNLYYTSSTVVQPKIFRAYRTEASQINLDGMFNLGNISFNRACNHISPYLFVGAGALAYITRINALNSSYKPYDFASIVTGNSTFSNRFNTWKKLQNHMDNTYESKAATADNRSTVFGDMTADIVASVGAGVEIKISKRVNIQVEDRLTFTEDRFVDGTELDTRIGIYPTISSAKEDLNYFSVGINFNIGNKKKNVEPLYWMNPLDFAYNELSYPRHMQLPNPELADEDGDGVTDQFDKCPNTPAGVAVDVHGCPLDTDGDGVPDYKDKQLITPTECQPVDADGVGKCPCPDGCGGGAGAGGGNHPCGSISSGTIVFSGKSARITSAMQGQLAALASQMNANPQCKVVLSGAGKGSKLEQERSWEHVHALIEYLNEKQSISRDRFIFQYGQEGDPNTVMYRSANEGEEGPSGNVPPPFPNLKEREGREKH
jgi:OmpA-OmpF porin, OOP family